MFLSFPKVGFGFKWKVFHKAFINKWPYICQMMPKFYPEYFVAKFMPKIGVLTLAPNIDVVRKAYYKSLTSFFVISWIIIYN